MLLPPVEMLAPAAQALPSSVLIGDVFDAISGFAGSPAILLVPISAGALIAGLIILILVKSAG